VTTFTSCPIHNYSANRRCTCCRVDIFVYTALIDSTIIIYSYHATYFDRQTAIFKFVIANQAKGDFFSNGSTAPWGPRPPHCSRLHDHTLRHTTLGRTPLDEGPARRRDLCLTTHNTHKRQTSMPSAGFETTIPVSERPQTYALDRAATGIGKGDYLHKNVKLVKS
jgi:hypothetical protein